MKKKYFKECYLEKIYHYDALEVWKKLEVGTQLSLELNGENIILKDSKDHILGELNPDDSKFIIDLLKQGWNSVCGATISYLVENASENKRIKVVLYINEAPVEYKAPRIIVLKILAER